MTDITLSNVTNLQDTTSSQNIINSNNSAIVTAVEASVAKAGDTMSGNIDMNSNRILNLPAPASATEPVRVQDLATLDVDMINIMGVTTGQGCGVTVIPFSETTGYDVWLLVGQSNMVGNGYEYSSVLDTTNSRIFEYPLGGPYANTIIQASEPFYHYNTQEIGPPALIGPALSFGRALIGSMPTNRSILFVPAAANGTSFTGGYWQAPTVSGTTAQIVVSAQPTAAANDTIVINGTTITLVSGSPSGNQIQYSSNLTTLASNLATFVNANTSSLGVNAGTVSNGEFTLFANTAGIVSIAVAQGTGTAFLFGGSSSTSLGGGAPAAGGTGYINSVAGVNQAIALSPNNQIKGILWLQGEADSTMSGSYYQTLLSDLFTAFRANITGAANVPIIVMGMVPEWVETVPGVQAIAEVHQTIPQLFTYSQFSPGATGSASSTDGSGEPIFHFDAPTQRINGNNAYTAYLRALGNVLNGLCCPPTNIQTTGITQTQATVLWAPPPLGNTRVLTWTLQYRVSGTSTWTSIEGIGANTMQTLSPNVGLYSQNLTGLTANTKYDIQVFGVNEQGNGTPSPIVNFTTLAVEYMIDEFFLLANNAYSLTKLRSSYSGSCIKAYRSDGVQQDIGFNSNGYLDTTSLINFSAGLSVYVTKWYDQTGNGNDAVQTTLANMPMIVNSGVLITQNDLPAVSFYKNGSNPTYLKCSSGYPSGDLTFTVCAMFPSISGFQYLIGGSGSDTHGFLLDSFELAYAVSGATGSPVLDTSATLTDNINYTLAVTYTSSSGDVSLWHNNNVTGTGSVSTGGTGTNVEIGCNNETLSDQAVCYMSEAIVLPSVLVNAQLSNIEASQKRRFNAT